MGDPAVGDPRGMSMAGAAAVGVAAVGVGSWGRATARNRDRPRARASVGVLPMSPARASRLPRWGWAVPATTARRRKGQGPAGQGPGAAEASRVSRPVPTRSARRSTVADSPVPPGARRWTAQARLPPRAARRAPEQPVERQCRMPPPAGRRSAPARPTGRHGRGRGNATSWMRHAYRLGAATGKHEGRRENGTLCGQSQGFRRRCEDAAGRGQPGRLGVSGSDSASTSPLRRRCAPPCRAAPARRWSRRCRWGCGCSRSTTARPHARGCASHVTQSAAGRRRSCRAPR